MRTHLIAVALLVAAGCSSKGSPPQPEPPGPMNAFQPGIYLADNPARFAAGQQVTRFNFAYLDDLYVRVTVPQMQGMSTLHLSFDNPKGEQLFEDHVPFSTDPSQTETTMPTGEAWVLRGTPLPGGYALDRAVAIMGTVFTRYPPDGDWQVSASVDGFMPKLSVPMHVVMAR